MKSNILTTKIHIGAPAPLEILHISDTHLTYADMRDGERKVALAKERASLFPLARQVLALAGSLSREEGLPIVHTGDLIDFVSEKNLEEAARFVRETDCFVTAGNHEFSLYVGEAREDAAYREQSLPTVQKAFQNDIRMSSRVIGGVNLVALDNGYYLFDGAQLSFLKREVERGLPVILLLHNPLYEEALYEKMMERSACAYLVGVPEEKMRGYPEERREQQRADAITRATVEYIAHESAIGAIIAGHLHFNYEGVFAERIPQIVTSCTDIRRILIG